MKFPNMYAKMWAEYETNYMSTCSNEKEELFRLMEKYDRLVKPSDEIFSTVFAYKKGEVVYKGSYNKWIGIDERKYYENLKANEKPIIEYVVNENIYNEALEEYEKERTDLINEILDYAFNLFDYKNSSDEIRKICWSLIETSDDCSNEKVNNLEKYIFVAKYVSEIEEMKFHDKS